MCVCAKKNENEYTRHTLIEVSLSGHRSNIHIVAHVSASLDVVVVTAGTVAAAAAVAIAEVVVNGGVSLAVLLL